MMISGISVHTSKSHFTVGIGKIVVGTFEGIHAHWSIQGDVNVIDRKIYTVGKDIYRHAFILTWEIGFAVLLTRGSRYSC